MQNFLEKMIYQDKIRQTSMYTSEIFEICDEYLNCISVCVSIITVVRRTDTVASAATLESLSQGKRRRCNVLQESAAMRKAVQISQAKGQS